MSFLSCESIDDLLTSAINLVEQKGIKIHPSKGAAIEVTGVLFELTDPRSRLSRTESRGKVFSAIGELAWYLSGSSDVSHMRYYVPTYERHLTGDSVPSAYGPRAILWNQTKQINNVMRQLRRRDSRRAVIQLFDATDLRRGVAEAPCTCTMQFLNRSDRLDLHVSMRSNDLIKGFPHDVFCFTMIQEIFAARLGLGLGKYKHFVGSLHKYVRHDDEATEFIGEGLQDNVPMPTMPTSDVCGDLKRFLEAERVIRESGYTEQILEGVTPEYWRDIVALLGAFRIHKSRKNPEMLSSLYSELSSDVYKPYIQAKIDQHREGTNDPTN